MSSMLEQAIVDAQALREAALKNAEQTLIEKFAPQIKEAVESLLEGEVAETKRKVSYEGKNYSLMEIEGNKATIMREGEKAFIVETSELDEELLQEEETGMADPEAAEEEMLEPFEDMPYGFQGDGEQEVVYDISFGPGENQIDFGEIISNKKEEPPQESYDQLAGDVGAPPAEAAEEGGDDLGLDLGGEEAVPEEEGEEGLVQEIMNLISEMNDEDEDLLEEELIVDMGQEKTGYNETFEPTLQYEVEMQLAKEAALEKEKENKELKESIKHLKHKNLQYKDAVEKLSQKLNETLLSNAKLLYSNKTLGDASLNERQKNKIVEAIAKARTPEEAKNLCETLNATVTSGQDSKSPRTLSESVTRKSTLSGILPRKTQVDESPEHTFAEKMKKLAGIK